MDAGIVGTWKRLCEWTGMGLGGGATSPSALGGGGAGRRGSNASSLTTSIAVPGSGGGGVYGSWGGGFAATYTLSIRFIIIALIMRAWGDIMGMREEVILGLEEGWTMTRRLLSVRGLRWIGWSMG